MGPFCYVFHAYHISGAFSQKQIGSHQDRLCITPTILVRGNPKLQFETRKQTWLFQNDSSTSENSGVRLDTSRYHSNSLHMIAMTVNKRAWCEWPLISIHKINSLWTSNYGVFSFGSLELLNHLFRAYTPWYGWCRGADAHTSSDCSLAGRLVFQASHWVLRRQTNS